MSFDGKTAVVTGVGGGMGLAIANDLVAAGARVTGLDLKARPDDLVPEVTYHQGDVADDGAVQAAVEQAYGQAERLDYLVNGAGVLWFGRDVSMTETDLEIWDQVLKINLRSMVHTTRHAVPLMKRTGGGAMVHIASVQALRGDSKPQDAYQAAKAAIISLSKSLAVQFAADGIRSNTLCPGGTYTPMQGRWDDDPGQLEAAARAVPLGRVGTTQDMSNAVLFLLSDRASFITGTELIVDGGRLALP
ncbi:MAG: SDR family oxidoreductase [Pseudomonadota bacterium]